MCIRAKVRKPPGSRIRQHLLYGSIRGHAHVRYVLVRAMMRCDTTCAFARRRMRLADARPDHRHRY